MVRYSIRVLLILLAAGVVAGALYGFSLTSAAQSFTSEHGDRHGGPEGEAWEGEQPSQPSFDGEGVAPLSEGQGRPEGMHGDDEFSLVATLPGLGGHLLVVVVLSLLVAGIEKGINKMSSRSKNQPLPHSG